MRGKEMVNLLAPTGSRITPAYAGKSEIGQPKGATSRDHPRLCGEKLLIFSR